MNKEEIDKITANFGGLQPDSLQHIIRKEMENISAHINILAVALRIISRQVACPICIDTGTVSEEDSFVSRHCHCAKGQEMRKGMITDIIATHAEEVGTLETRGE